VEAYQDLPDPLAAAGCSSPTSSATTTARPLRPGQARGNRVAAVSHGAAHWLFGGEEESLYTTLHYTIDVSIDTGNIGATKIPIRAYYSKMTFRFGRCGTTVFAKSGEKPIGSKI
jgi:hypothetical protein